MAIEWLVRRQMEERLLHDYPAPGLWLYSFLDGRWPPGIDPRAAFDRAPEQDDWAPGLGVEDGWRGIADGVPFALAVKQDRETGRWGFHLWLPLRVHEDGRMDVGWMLRATSSIVPSVGGIDRPWFDSLPFEGRGWAVAYEGDPKYSLWEGPMRNDADEVLRFIAPGATLDTYAVVAVGPSGNACWIVAGPRLGDFISRVVVCGSREQADKRAAGLSVEHGVPFTVRPGSTSG
jgi:hypothetical protein